MIDTKPSTWLGPGYSLASHVAGFNTLNAPSNPTLPQLTDVNADPASGDVRELMFAMCDAFYQAWNAQLAANNRPIQINCQRSIAPGASGTNQQTYEYTFSFVVLPTGQFTIPPES